MKTTRRAMRNHTGHRVGEWHPRAKHSSDDIHLVRALHAEGLGYGTIAKKMEIPKSTVRYYCTQQRRAYD